MIFGGGQLGSVADRHLFTREGSVYTRDDAAKRVFMYSPGRQWTGVLPSMETERKAAACGAVRFGASRLLCTFAYSVVQKSRTI